MKLTPDPSTLTSIDIKRFYLPFLATDNCPTCGAESETDLYRDGSYLSYPSLVAPEAIYFYCETCKKEWANWVRITFSIAPCDPPEKTSKEDDDAA